MWGRISVKSRWHVRCKRFGKTFAYRSDSIFVDLWLRWRLCPAGTTVPPEIGSLSIAACSSPGAGCDLRSGVTVVWCLVVPPCHGGVGLKLPGVGNGHVTSFVTKKFITSSMLKHLNTWYFEGGCVSARVHLHLGRVYVGSSFAARVHHEIVNWDHQNQIVDVFRGILGCSATFQNIRACNEADSSLTSGFWGTLPSAGSPGDVVS